MPTDIPLLDVRAVTKRYYRGRLRRNIAFSLEAAFSIEKPEIVGVLGPNGSGKTTLFELITGSNQPDSGSVLIRGKDIHHVRTDERDRLAIHYHQAYQVRRFKSRTPNFLLERADSEYPWVHLFDEPQLNTKDGYMDFTLAFFERLREQGRLVFVCIHPTEEYHLKTLRRLCSRFIFIHNGAAAVAGSFEELLGMPEANSYLGRVASNA